MCDHGKNIYMPHLATIEAMHDETWTQRMADGWESELHKLEKVLAR